MSSGGVRNVDSGALSNGMSLRKRTEQFGYNLKRFGNALIRKAAFVLKPRNRLETEGVLNQRGVEVGFGFKDSYFRAIESFATNEIGRDRLRDELPIHHY
jgi:hypothetical protein